MSWEGAPYEPGKKMSVQGTLKAIDDVTMAIRG
jgi:hypothetical protein